MVIRYILSIISILFITLSSFAQGGLPSRYNVSYLNMAAGMPNNFADDIFQDSYGFVWLVRMVVDWCATMASTL